MYFLSSGSEHTDLTYFLDAAHGDEFSHQTCRDRDKLFKKKTLHPSNPVELPEQLCLKPTNVHVLWLMQELYFAKYWAQLAVNKPIGLVQRFLFSFSAKLMQKNVQWNGFFEKVVGPIVADLFRLVLKTFGPKAPGALDCLQLSSSQTKVAADIEETLTLFAQRKRIGQTMRAAMPKAFYWFGTALLGNWVMSSCMNAVLSGESQAPVVKNISDALYVACVNFLHRRYLYGQCVLACGVKEQVWNGIDAEEPHALDEDNDLLLRALRLHAGASVSLESLLLCDVSSKRTMEMGSVKEKAVCRSRLQNTLRTMCDLGLGQGTKEPETGNLLSVRKYSRCSLPAKATEWLRHHRVSLALFGPVGSSTEFAKAADSAEKSAGSKQRSNNNVRRQNTLQARAKLEEKVLSAHVVPDNILTPADLRVCLGKRTEFQSFRVVISRPRVVPNMLVCNVSCLEDAACPVHWEVHYFMVRCGCIPVKTLRITQSGEHDHTGESNNSGKIFTPLTLRVAEAIVQETPSRQLTFLVFTLQLRQRLQDKGLGTQYLPSDGQMSNWLKRAKGKKSSGAWEHIPQPTSQGMVESTAIRVQDLRRWFTDRPDELVIIPDNSQFTTYLVSNKRTLVQFASRGMFETLKKFTGDCAHIVVDTKMKMLKKQRGVATVYLQVKDGLRNTSFHFDKRRVQGRALTSHDMPVLQAIVDEESSENHADIFMALKYLWQQAKPQGPAFETVFTQMGKDYAPGIEAARRNYMPFMRPVDDFFHFMGKQKEMEVRCHKTTVEANGKAKKTHLAWSRAVLYAIQNGATPDLLHEVWGAYLRRLVTKEEIVLAMYFCQQYSRVLTVKELREMHVFPNTSTLTDQICWLSWSAGFSVFPGSNSGSQGGEAAHSAWQKQLAQLGSHWELEDALRFMQDLYTGKWLSMYNWENNSANYSMLPPVRDPQMINGRLLASLGRSTMFDFCTVAATQIVARLLPCNGNFFVVMPRNVDICLPALDMARLGCEILGAKGARLRELLFHAGILYRMSEQEKTTLQNCYLAERDRCNPARQQTLKAFGKVTGIAEDAACTEPLFSLQAYNALFIDVAYVVRDHPSGAPDTWPYLRCTCRPFSQHAPCEHVEYAKTLDIPDMKDTPNSSDNVPEVLKRGRKKGSHTTARGKAAAFKKATEAS